MGYVICTCKIGTIFELFVNNHYIKKQLGNFERLRGFRIFSNNLQKDVNKKQIVVLFKYKLGLTRNFRILGLGIVLWATNKPIMYSINLRKVFLFFFLYSPQNLLFSFFFIHKILILKYILY